MTGTTVQPPLASLDLLRQLTDRHVLGQLLTTDGLTRAEIATRTGISKPTISESMRRLDEAGLVAEAGSQQGRRGRAGLRYTVRDDVGCALAASAGPDGLVAELRSLQGVVLRRAEQPVRAPVTSAQLGPGLAAVVDEVLDGRPGPVLAGALSLAGPVDKATGRLVRLPDSPFLVDELDPRGLLGDRLPALRVDNDVNWEALAEALTGHATDLDEFFYCHLGYGLGGAVVRDRQPAVGSAGLAGEIAHVRTTGPGGVAMRLVECFAALGLTRPGLPTLDVDRVRASLAGSSPAERRRRDDVLMSIAGVLSSAVAILNPAGILLGGPWGREDAVRERLPQLVAESAAVPVEVRFARFGEEGPLTGAGLHAVDAARESLLRGDAPR